MKIVSKTKYSKQEQKKIKILLQKSFDCNVVLLDNGKVAVEDVDSKQYKKLLYFLSKEYFNASSIGMSKKIVKQIQTAITFGGSGVVSDCCILDIGYNNLKSM